jgi:hypothetical protein
MARALIEVFQKVMPISRIDGLDLLMGPFYEQARALYSKFAHGDASINP